MSLQLPLTNIFRRPWSVLLTLLLVTGVTIFLACGTQIGFPYRQRTNSARVAYQVFWAASCDEFLFSYTYLFSLYQHVRRIFYEYDGSVSKDDSGYLFNFQDRRQAQAFPGVNLTGAISQTSNCDTHMMCGVPLFDERWVGNRLQGMWLPREEPIVPPTPANLELLSKTVLNDTKTVRFEFRLTGPNYLSLFVQAYEDDYVTVSDWSFSRSYLEQKPALPLSYHMYITYGSNAPLEFSLDLTVSKLYNSFWVFMLSVFALYRKRMETSMCRCSN